VDAAPAAPRQDARAPGADAAGSTTVPPAPPDAAIRPPDAAPATGGTDTAPAGAADAAPGRADGGSGPEPPPADGGSGPVGGDGLEQLLLSRAIGLGYYHSCFILPDRSVRCFNPDPGTEPDPRSRPPAIRTEQIAGAHNGFCALQPPGGPRLRCWGHNPSFFPPAAVTTSVDPIHFGVGYDHGCVLNRDQSVVCWGQPGTNNRPPDGLRARSLAVASFFTCAVTDGDGVVCWGIRPPAPPAGLKAKLVAATTHGNAKLPEANATTRHACAITLDDTVTCWGDDVEGNLAVPPDLGRVKDVAVATYDSCAIRADGTPICWGRKYYNTSPDRYHPMPAGLKLKSFRSKLATYCGIRLDDTLACWGDEQHSHITFPADMKVYFP
jgi:hypothetical protein